MYASRVLPPPLALTADNPPRPGPSPVYGVHVQPKPDALLEHKIMTNYGYGSDHSAPPSRTRSRSPPKTLRRSEEGQTIRSEEDERPSTPNVAGMKRKRAPTVSQGRSHHGNPAMEANAAVSREQLPSMSGGALAAKPVDSPSQICLCQPDPKVPRPRNAFILYRQHHQAKVVSENPGLANPDISKIIGDLWRQSAPEVKQHWKNLAEEEKIRHQRQYPDYRYQPKRGRNSVPTAIPPGQGSPRCLKCGGKSMTATNLASPGLRSANSGPTAAPMESPMSPYHAAGMMPRTPYGVAGGYGLSPEVPHAYISRVTSATRPAEHSPSLESPEAKRRRYEAGGGRYQTSRNGLPTPIPLTPLDQRLPRPEFMKPGSSGFVMGPAPPARVHHHHQHQHHRPSPLHGPAIAHAMMQSQGSARNDNLTLAPLQINRHASDPSQTQAKSVEAMIMSIKPLAKIKTLAKISPPLRRPGPTSPPHPIRGAVISVEGSDFDAMELVGAYLRADLEREGQFTVRAWESPQLECYDANRKWTLLDVLQLMTHWHGISSEVVKYITRVPERNGEQPDSPVSPKTHWMNTKMNANVNANVNTNAEWNQSSHGGKHVGGEGNAHYNEIGTRGGERPMVPIALIPNYQLTTTDNAASMIPISDYYSPIDHWQWMAALWRGTVGPDVIICVRGVNDGEGTGSGSGASPREDSSGSNGGGGGNGGNNGPSPSTGTGSGGNPGASSSGNGTNSANKQAKSLVEVKLEEARTVIVWCEKRGVVGENVLRRVAFEVGEWLRGREDRGGD